MSYACSVQPERLPVINQSCLIINQGTDDIILGDTPAMLAAYGTHIGPNQNLIYDLSRQRYIAANSGTQHYDILPGGASAVPGSTAIANSILNSQLANNIATATSAQIVASTLAANVATATTTDLLSSGLSAQIATQVLNTGTRVIDVPTTQSWSLFHNTTIGVFDLTQAQSFVIPWFWQVNNVANTSPFGELTLTWFDDNLGTNKIGTDQYELPGNLNTPGTILTTETGYIRGPCSGAGLQIGFLGKAPAPANSSYIQATGKLITSYRLTPISRWSTDASADRILITNLQAAVPASSASLFVSAAPYDGLVEIHAFCSNVATTNSTHIRLGWGSDSFPSSPVFRDVMYFPQGGFGSWVSRQVSGGSRRPMWFQFFNGETGARDFTVFVTCPTLA